jgi:TPR repeat protein
MGIGCRRDPLEANVWYVRAADKGNETARQRLQIIRAAASGNSNGPIPIPAGVQGVGKAMEKGEARRAELMDGNGEGRTATMGRKKRLGIF